MTLTAADIGKIQDLYGKLERLHGQRAAIKEMTALNSVSGEIRRGTSGLSLCEFRDFSPEATKDIKDIIVRDLRRRAAKIVETLHKHGCEAKLTEE